jgi:hypothetical protein
MQPGDRAEARDAEERAHLGLADDRLGLDRRQHADERLLDVLGQLVDDAVLADLDPLPLGELARLGRGTHVEADDHRVRGGGEVDVVLGDRADARVDHVDAHLGCSIFSSSPTIASTEPCTSPLRTMLRSCDAAGLHLLEELLERDAAARLLRERLAAQPPPRCCASSRARRSFSTTRPSSPAGGGWSKPRISTGSPGAPARRARRGSRRARGRGPTRRRRRSRRRP